MFGTPIAVPAGEWVRTLQTTWVEPGYLETGTSWCEPGGTPASPLANGGAFGGKVATDLGAVARRLADEHGRAVRVLLAKTSSAGGPKRPPLAAATPTGRGSSGGADRRDRDRDRLGRARARRGEIDIVGPPTSARDPQRRLGRGGGPCSTPAGEPVGSSHPMAARHARWCTTTAPSSCLRARSGARRDGAPLRIWRGPHGPVVGDERVARRRYDGEIHDLTIRSFGVLRAVDMPPVEVVIDGGAAETEPVSGKGAVFTVAAAVWRAAVPGSVAHRLTGSDRGCPSAQCACSAAQPQEKRMSKPVGPYTPIAVAACCSPPARSDSVTARSCPEARTRAATGLLNLRTVLEAGRRRPDRRQKTTVFLVDMGLRHDERDLHGGVRRSPVRPRSAVAVAALPLGARVEIEAIAEG
ncbi:MAG: RidA family protein [Acidimicrobiales bacterium]